jgi:hypothetical protein
MVCALNRPLLILLCLTGLQGQVLAERLDDSLSPRRQVNLELQWKYQGNLDSLSDVEFNAVTAQARNLDTRLDTSAYIGSDARIFLELPILVRGLGNPSSLLLSWTTGGLFNPGRVTPGNRTLIYEGGITQAVMRDIITFTFELDARYLLQPLRLEPVYEIEIITP